MGENNFITACQQEAEKKYYEKLTYRVSSVLTKYFGSSRSIEVVKALKNGYLKINNPENLFFLNENLNDSSLAIALTEKDIEKYIDKSLLFFKRKLEVGEKGLRVFEFFLGLAIMLSKCTYVLAEYNWLENTLKKALFIFSLVEKESPFEVIIISSKSLKKLAEIRNLNIDISLYITIVESLVKVYKELQESCIGLNLPSIKELHLFFEENSKMNIEAIYLKPAHNQNNVYYLNLIKSNKELFKQKLYINAEQFEKTLAPYSCNISIDCFHQSYEDIENLIGMAKDLCLAKEYYFMETEPSSKNNTLRITLEDVTNLSVDFLNEIKQKEKQLRSLYNKNFILNIVYNTESLQKMSTTHNINERLYDFTHIRVISDIHADYNRDNGYEFDFGSDYVINCGDTAGNAMTAREWLKKYMHKGVFVIGNHLGYSPAFPELDLNVAENMQKFGSTTHPDNTKNSQVLVLSKVFTGNNGVRILSNSETEIDGVKVLGTTLYTDFALYGEGHVEESMALAKQGMNDFKCINVIGHREYVRTPEGWKKKLRKRSESKIRPFTPQDHGYFFEFSFNFLKEKVKEYKDKKIIIVTHHAPTPYAISPQYAGSPLNPAFASDLNRFIIRHPQIRLWTFGHIHTPCDFILGETRMVCCPFGYNNENNADLPYNYGKRIALEDIKSNKSWTTICEKEIKSGKMQVYKK